MKGRGKPLHPPLGQTKETEILIKWTKEWVMAKTGGLGVEGNA